MKGSKRPIKVRKRWAINHKTKVKRSEKVYYRPREKRNRKEKEYEQT